MFTTYDAFCLSTQFQSPDILEAGNIRFKSNLFGSLGAGMFVGPNLIDFGTVFDNIDQKLLENIAVLAVVFGILVAYIPAMVISNLADKADAMRVNIDDTAN